MSFFKFNASMGKLLLETQLRSMGAMLGVKRHVFKGDMGIRWDEIRNGFDNTVLFIHGFSDRKESFYFAARYLSCRFNVIMPELPGFGSSQKDNGRTYGVENYVGWFREFLASPGIPKVHLVGNSLGGCIAAHLALEMPEKVKSLTLVNAAGFVLENHNAFYEDFFRGSCPFLIQSEEEYQELCKRIFFRPIKAPPFVREHLVKEMLDNHDWYRKVLNDNFDGDSVEQLISENPHIVLNNCCEDLEDIKVPVNILWGKEDTLFPYQMAEYAHGAIKGSRLRLLDNLGHCPQLENPRVFSRVLAELLTSC